MKTDDFTYSEDGRVIEHVNALLAYYRLGARSQGRRLAFYKTGGLVFSIAVTVLSGIGAVSQHLPWIVTVAGGLATLFTGMLSVTKAQEYYMTSGSQHAKIYSEKLLFMGSGGPYAHITSEPGKVRLLAERVSEIYAGGAKEWENLNRPARSGTSGSVAKEPHDS